MSDYDLMVLLRMQAPRRQGVLPSVLLTIVSPVLKTVSDNAGNW